MIKYITLFFYLYFSFATITYAGIQILDKPTINSAENIKVLELTSTNPANKFRKIIDIQEKLSIVDKGGKKITGYLGMIDENDIISIVDEENIIIEKIKITDIRKIRLKANSYKIGTDYKIATVEKIKFKEKKEKKEKKGRGWLNTLAIILGVPLVLTLIGFIILDN